MHHSGNPVFANIPQAEARGVSPTVFNAVTNFTDKSTSSTSTSNVLHLLKFITYNEGKLQHLIDLNPIPSILLQCGWEGLTSEHDTDK